MRYLCAFTRRLTWSDLVQIVDPLDSSKKSTTFQCLKPVSVRHIGFAIGPFEEVNLTAFRESDEDDRLGRSAVPVHGFCLPGRAAEVRNTCFPLAKVCPYFSSILTTDRIGYGLYSHGVHSIPVQQL